MKASTMTDETTKTGLEVNQERVKAGLPQLATKSAKKALSLADICKQEGAKAPTTKTGIVPASIATLRKVCPELIDGLIDPVTLKNRPGTLMQIDSGKWGRKGNKYICRFVAINKSLARLILDKFGKANRTRTKSKQTDYTDHMNVGIGGDSGAKGFNLQYSNFHQRYSRRCNVNGFGTT
jgi:hypothetical protein